MEKIEFNGKLTQKELKDLKEQLVSEKDIKLIEEYLTKYKEYLTSYQDLAGDHFIDNKSIVNEPGKMFFFNMKNFGYLLENDPNKFLEYKGIYKILKPHVIPLIKKLGPNFMNSPMQFENRNFLKDEQAINESDCLPDTGIELPKEPVIWTPNHHFKDDALASVLSCYKYDRSICMLFGSLPQFYNTFDGILSYLVGVILINRKNAESKKASIEKMKSAIAHNKDIMYCPEGVWGKSPNEMILKLWPGIYHIAQETGSKLVPVIHYIKDPAQRIEKADNTIHTVIDDPIDLVNMSGLSEKAALDYYRDVLATWYYLMAEKYGKDTRENMMQGFSSATKCWEDSLTALNKTCDRLDSTIETTAHYQPKDIVTLLDVYSDIADLEITKENQAAVVDAIKLVREQKENNFQGRF